MQSCSHIGILSGIYTRKYVYILEMYVLIHF